MKKLMIVAAVAAMIGGAQAETYKYTASLKTTTGKAAGTKTYTVNCGLSNEGKYWWDDLGLGYTTADQAKRVINGYDDAEKRAFAKEYLGFDEGAFEAAIAAGVNKKNIGTTNYPVQEVYKGKLRWCFTFTYKVSQCYRVATSVKIDRTIYAPDACPTDCCNYYEKWYFANGTEIDAPLMYRFNGVELSKATKVELFLQWQQGEWDANPTAPLTDFVEMFYAAGQGTWDNKKDCIKTVSGNIVGIIKNPGCKDCCNYPIEALCFNCDGDVLDVDEEEAEYEEDAYSRIVTEDGIYGAGTAAYGTWSITLK